MREVEHHESTSLPFALKAHRPSRPFLSLSLLAVACGTSPLGPTTLESAQAVAHLAAFSGAGLQDFLTLSSTGTSEESCPALLGMSEATVDDEQLKLSMSGSWHGKGGLTCVTDCAARCDPHVWAAQRSSARPDVAETTFRLKDATTTWSMTVQHIYGKRLLSRATATPLHAGDTATLEWSQPTDVVGFQAPTAHLLTEDGGSRLASTDGGVVAPGASLPLLYDAGVFEFGVPANLQPGTYFVFVEVPPVPRITSCVGPKSCSADVSPERNLVRISVEK